MSARISLIQNVICHLTGPTNSYYVRTWAQIHLGNFCLVSSVCSDKFREASREDIVQVRGTGPLMTYQQGTEGNLWRLSRTALEATSGRNVPIREVVLAPLCQKAGFSSWKLRLAKSHFCPPVPSSFAVDVNPSWRLGFAGSARGLLHGIPTKQKTWSKRI